MHWWKNKIRRQFFLVLKYVFIEPESDHWLPCLVDLIDATLACEDASSKLVEVVTVDNVDAEDHVGNSLSQIWDPTFGPKAKLLFRPFLLHFVT